MATAPGSPFGEFEKRMPLSSEPACFFAASRVIRLRRYGSPGLDVERQDFTGFALGKNFKGSAADFAVGGEALFRDRRVDDEFHGLSAVRTLDSFRAFHGQTCSSASRRFRSSAMSGSIKGSRSPSITALRL